MSLAGPTGCVNEPSSFRVVEKFTPTSSFMIVLKILASSFWLVCFMAKRWPAFPLCPCFSLPCLFPGSQLTLPAPAWSLLPFPSVTPVYAFLRIHRLGWAVNRSYNSSTEGQQLRCLEQGIHLTRHGTRSCLGDI